MAERKAEHCHAHRRHPAIAESDLVVDHSGPDVDVTIGWLVHLLDHRMQYERRKIGTIHSEKWKEQSEAMSGAIATLALVLPTLLRFGWTLTAFWLLLAQQASLGRVATKGQIASTPRS